MDTEQARPTLLLSRQFGSFDYLRSCVCSNLNFKKVELDAAGLTGLQVQVGEGLS